MAQIMDGKQIAAKVRGEIAAECAELVKKGIVPGLAVIIVGDDPASKVYVRNKKKACEEVGFHSEVYSLEMIVVGCFPNSKCLGSIMRV